MNRVYSKQNYKHLLERMLKSMRVAELIRAERFDNLQESIQRERQRGLGLGIQFRGEVNKSTNTANQPGMDFKLANSIHMRSSKQRNMPRGLEEYLKELQHVYSIKERQLDEAAFRMQEKLKTLQGRIDQLEINQMNEMKQDVLGRQNSREASGDTSLQRSYSDVNSLIESISVELNPADFNSRVIGQQQIPEPDLIWRKKPITSGAELSQISPQTKLQPQANQPKFTGTELDEGFQDFLRRKELRQSARLAQSRVSAAKGNALPDRLPISQISRVSSRYSQQEDDQDPEEAEQDREMQRFGINSDIESILSED